MPIFDRDQVSELVEYADVAVRVASQLRLLRNGRAIHDLPALQKAKDFLREAQAGGNFMSSGNFAQLQTTLLPLNWAADVRLGATGISPSAPQQTVDYRELAAILSKLEQTLALVVSGQELPSAEIDAGVDFFESLGNILGTRADRTMRRSSQVDTFVSA